MIDLEIRYHGVVGGVLCDPLGRGCRPSSTIPDSVGGIVVVSRTRGDEMGRLDGSRILVTGSSVSDQLLDQLRAEGAAIENPSESFPPSVLSSDELIGYLSDVDAYLLGGDEQALRGDKDDPTDEVLSAAERLRLIAFLGVGYATFVDAEAARRHGVAVTNTPGVLANSVAEFAIAMLLDGRRQITDYVCSRRIAQPMKQEKRFDLHAHPIGIVGLGATGIRTAEILRNGFGADVAYFSRTRKPAEEDRLGLTYVDSLPALAAGVEALILMVPENPETTGFIDREVLSQHSPQSPLMIVATSRPEVIDAQALLWALREGLVDSVWLDDFYLKGTSDTEPLSSDPRVRITPHVGSLTHDARDAMSRMAIDSIITYLVTGDDVHIVNR